MPYKMITNVGKLCGRLAGAAFEHRDLIADSLLARWRDRLAESEDFAALRQILTLVGEDLHRQHDALVAVENNLSSELREDREFRILRDTSYIDSRELLIESKVILTLGYGPGGPETFWGEAVVEVPQDPAEVLRQCTRLRANLVDPSFPRPPERPDVMIDLVAFALRFDAPTAALRRAILGLDRGTQGSNRAISDKERELTREQKQAVLAGRLLEALTAYAGHEGVAQRIRLSRHRPSALASPVTPPIIDSDPANGDNAPADDPPPSLRPGAETADGPAGATVSDRTAASDTVDDTDASEATPPPDRTAN